ncbi:BEL1-like homeodomain 9 [Brachionus plicatilis]|uniref:BEL1-like homeodomain 9 n=1 Tax=Brachionus plicatilis TaxID=10195 RepID=A0A3M7PI88_BRAPC|nr:BEL1-like homeodomain 9 [Brachionus plicatilis]
MLSTCEIRDEFAILEPQTAHKDKSELFDDEKSAIKSFIDPSLLSIEAAEHEPHSEPFQKELPSVRHQTFVSGDLAKEPCFKDDTARSTLVQDKATDSDKEIDESQKRKIGSIDDITNEKSMAHLNKRKRTIVRKSPLDLPNDAENVFDDEEVDLVLEKMQPVAEPNYISKKHRQIRKLDSGEKSAEIVFMPEQIKIKRAKALPERATKIMKDWFEANILNPYPTDEERKLMAEQGEISENQVKAWFANKRNRSSNTKSKLKSKNSFQEEANKMVDLDERIQLVKKDNHVGKKCDFYPKNFDQNKCKFSPINLQTCPQYLPNMDIYNYADKNPMNSRYVCKQPQANNFSNYYSYFPKQESKFIDLNNNYFSPYPNQTNNCDYNRYYPNMYSPMAQSDNYMNQNFLNPPSANTYQYFEPSFAIPCSHSFAGYNDSAMTECTICVNCNQEGVQNDFVSPNAQTQRCDTPPPIVTKNSVRSGDGFIVDEIKSSESGCVGKNSALSRHNSQSKFLNIPDGPKHENFNLCTYPPSSSSLQFSDFVPMQTNSNNFIKSSMLPESLNNESVTSLLDTINQAQNNLCVPSAPGCFPPSEYNGSTVTINNINYTNPNGSLINSISSILTKPGSMPPSSTSSIDSTSPSNLCFSNGSESFGSMFNMAFNSIINRNSPFQKYGSQKCSKSAKAPSSGQCEQDARFSDPKAKEWCMKSHPKLASTLLNSNCKTNGQQNACLAESKAAQHYG